MPETKEISFDLRKKVVVLTKQEMGIHNDHSISTFQELEPEVSQENSKRA